MIKTMTPETTDQNILFLNERIHFSLHCRCNEGGIIYSEAIKSIQFLILNTGSLVNGCVKMFLLSNCQTTSSAKHKLDCFAVINNGVMVLNSNPVVPIKTRFAHDKRHSAHHKCLARMSVSKTTS